MPLIRHSPQQLREIALGLISGTIMSDWLSNDHGMPPLSEVEQLIHSTRDIGMMYERRENAMDHDDLGNIIFSTFHTLTGTEASQVMELVLRYRGFLDAYREVEISHS